jgi:hypothetical protein
MSSLIQTKIVIFIPKHEENTDLSEPKPQPGNHIFEQPNNKPLTNQTTLKIQPQK